MLMVYFHFVWLSTCDSWQSTVGLCLSKLHFYQPPTLLHHCVIYMLSIILPPHPLARPCLFASALLVH